MTISELRERYKDELSSNPGDRALRYQLFAPFFENLFENKVVYHERFACLARLEDIEITPERIRATAVPLQSLYTGPLFPMPNRSWSFGSCWEGIQLGVGYFSVPYAGWTVWPEPARIKAVIEALKTGDLLFAQELTTREIWL